MVIVIAVAYKNFFFNFLISEFHQIATTPYETTIDATSSDARPVDRYAIKNIPTAATTALYGAIPQSLLEKWRKW